MDINALYRVRYKRLLQISLTVRKRKDHDGEGRASVIFAEKLYSNIEHWCIKGQKIVPTKDEECETNRYHRLEL